jgi:tRNA A37 threonylcarbamoyladenosine modification protein TsaB
MYKIYIDTTQRREKMVRLVEVTEEKILEEITGDLDVISTISRILKKHNLGLGDIQEVVPNVGPGSFTGIKVGVTIANVMNWALGKKSSTELYKPSYGSEPNISSRKSA